MNGKIRTVTGDIEPSEFGVAYCHEHLIARPGEPLLERMGTAEDLMLDDEDKSAAELELFAQAGGQGMIECSTREYGRDAGALARLSERTGVNVIASTGHIMEGYWRGIEDFTDRTDQDIVDELVMEITEGFEEAPDVKAGAIKVGTSKDTVHPDEERMLRAAAQVQQMTGAPITTHTTAGTIPMEQVRIFAEEGADLSHVIIGHQDRRLVWEDHLAVVEAGANLGYDCLSKEKYEHDSDRVEFVQRLIAEGYGGQVCFSGDIARRSYLTSYGGGPGFTYILWRFVPWLWSEGVSKEDTRKILVDNPARIFTFSEGGAK